MCTCLLSVTCGTISAVGFLRFAGVRLGTVYGLRDPRDRRIRYIGKTVLDPPHRRATGHISAARRGIIQNPHKHYWICQLLDTGQRPEFVLLERGVWTCDELNDAERRWILQAHAHDPSALTNLTAGGDGGFNDALRQRNARPWTEEERARHRDAMRAWWDERRAQGLTHTLGDEDSRRRRIETRRTNPNLSAALKAGHARWAAEATDEDRARRAAYMRSPEGRARKSKETRDRLASDEARQLLSSQCKTAAQRPEEQARKSAKAREAHARRRGFALPFVPGEERACAGCGTLFTSPSSTTRSCSAKCRAQVGLQTRRAEDSRGT